MTNCFNCEILIKSSVFDDLKGTTVSPFVYAVFPSPDVYMEGAMCIRLILTGMGIREAYERCPILVTLCWGMFHNT